jgi:hypothetical protein
MNRHSAIRSKIGRALIIFTFLVGFVFGTNPSLESAEGNPTLYPTEQTAQKHCPNDTVVWLNLPSGVYHFKGERWYGRTKNGAFVCEGEADKAGDRATENGQ